MAPIASRPTGEARHGRPSRNDRPRQAQGHHSAQRQPHQPRGEQDAAANNRAPQGERRPQGDGFGKKRFGGKPFVANDGQPKPFAGKPGGKRFGGNKRKFGGGGGRGPARAA